MSTRTDILDSLENRISVTEEADVFGHRVVLHGLNAADGTRVAVLTEKMQSGQSPRKAIDHPLVYALIRAACDESGRRIFTGADADVLLKRANLGELAALGDQISDLSGLQGFDDSEVRDAVKKDLSETAT